MNAGMFELVSRMNVAFGNPQGDPYLYEPDSRGPAADEAWDKLRKQCYNIGGNQDMVIAGEVKELLAALEKKDPIEVRDALCDIIVFALGAHHIMGYNANEDMEAVVAGVMTRFCKNIEELSKTMEKYRALGVRVYPEGEFPTMCLKSAEDQTGADGDTYPKGKFVKSVGYKKTVFFKLPPHEVHTFIKPSEQPKRRAYEQPVSVVDQMAQEREAKRAHIRAQLDNIEKRVAQRRTDIKRFFGLPEYDSDKNNAGEYTPPVEVNGATMQAPQPAAYKGSTQD